LIVLRAGTVSCFLKDIAIDELSEAVRRATRGKATFHPRVAARVIQGIHGARYESPNRFTELTDREM
jgi:DNA-binding NarL/FixJ family response regulator